MTPDQRTPKGYRASREAGGWTQAEYADLVDRDRMTIGGREGGRQELPLEAALALLYLIEHEGRTPWDEEVATAPAAPPGPPAAR